MDVRKVFDIVCSQLEAIEFEVKDDTGERLIFIASTSCRDYDDDIMIKIVLFESGYYHVFLTFDKLEKNFYNYDLINEFNSASNNGCIYIRDDGFLELHYNDTGADEYEMANGVFSYLVDIFNENVKEYLLPLTKRTK